VENKFGTRNRNRNLGKMAWFRNTGVVDPELVPYPAFQKVPDPALDLTVYTGISITVTSVMSLMTIISVMAWG
jgi:hypothetical protein